MAEIKEESTTLPQYSLKIANQFQEALNALQDACSGAEIQMPELRLKQDSFGEISQLLSNFSIFNQMPIRISGDEETKDEEIECTLQ